MEKIVVYIGKKDVTSYYAECEYDGSVYVVLPGGKISPSFASYIRGGKAALVYRNDPSYVDENGLILRECVFKSPSTAAQFVAGRSVNGYDVWKVRKKLTLGQYLKEKGLR